MPKIERNHSVVNPPKDLGQVESVKAVKGSLPLKWHGGKQYLADKIISLMPPHIHYVEPYFGGGAVLFRKDGTGSSEVVNDLNKELSTFWKVLQKFSTMTIWDVQKESTIMIESHEQHIKRIFTTTMPSIFFQKALLMEKLNISIIAKDS